jgi:hypothetical protein
VKVLHQVIFCFDGLTTSVPVNAVAKYLFGGNVWMGHFSSKEDIEARVVLLTELLPEMFSLVEKGGITFIKRSGYKPLSGPHLEEQLRAAFYAAR